MATAVTDFWDRKFPDSGSLETFAGSPSIESSNWNATDFTSYRKVMGTGAAQKGGLVYEFSIPDGAVVLKEIVASGKVGAVFAGNQINIRVYREDGTQIDTGGPYAITAATLTALSITSFSGATFVAGERFVVVMEGQVDDLEEVFIGDCRIRIGR